MSTVLVADVDDVVIEDDDFQTGRKMKCKAEFMTAFAPQFVFDQPVLFGLVEFNGSTMDYWLFQTRIAEMLRRNAIAFDRSLPIDDARTRFIAEYKGEIDARRVLFLAVNHNRRMISR